MFCKKCGTKQGDGDKFCRKCGTLYMILENDRVIQTVNDDLSNNERENNIRVQEEESNQVQEIQSCFSSKDDDESNFETPLVRDDEVVNDAKIHFNNNKKVGQAKNYFYLCITLSSILLLFLGLCKNNVFGDNMDGSNADNIENSYSNQNIENIKVKIISLAQENESLMKGMMRDYSYFEEQLHSFGRDISSSTYQSITKKKNQILENLNEIERLAKSIGVTDFSTDVERIRLSTEKSYKSILDKYGW